MQTLSAAPMAGLVAILADDEPTDLYPGRFKVLGIDAVIANQRISKGHQLAGVGRIGQNFLITGHARIEHNFAEALDLSAKTNTLVYRAVFQDQIGWLVQCSAPVHF